MNKVAFITGATRGIGKQIAMVLAENGYDIALNYRTENDNLRETIKEIESKNVKCLEVKGDVSSFEESERFVKEAIEKGALSRQDLERCAGRVLELILKVD